MRMLLLLCMCLGVHAQKPSLYFEKITVENGLSHNKVNCMLQDQRGFIWLGTDDGLNRYDGRHFTHYHSKPGEASGISGNIITDLLEDRQGRLWIATADGGLSRYDYRLPPQQQFKQYKHIPGTASSIPVNAVTTLLEDTAGFLWLGTAGNSVLRFDKATETFEDVTKNTKTILDLCLDKKGLIWVGRQGGGILKINPGTRTYSEDPRYKNLYAKLPHVTVTALFRDRDDAIWFGSWDKLLYKQDAATGAETAFGKGGAFSFENDEILCFAEDAQGRLWMGGKEKGLHIYDKRQNRFYNYTSDHAREGTISDNRINCIFITKAGGIWMGTNQGVSINNPQKQQFVQRFLPGDENAPVTIYDFFEPQAGTIWIGTNQGIFVQDKEGAIRQRRLFYKGNRLHVTSFFKDTDGTVYIGTDYSLFRYHPATNTVALLPNTGKDGVMSRIIESRVVSILKARIDGRPVLLVSPYGHFLAYYDLQKKQWVSRLDSMNILERFNLKDNLIRKMYKSGNGWIWMATAKQGLGIWIPDLLPEVKYLKYDPKDPSTIINNNVFDIAEDATGNFWVSTYGGGLHYYNVRSGKFTRIAATNNLVEGLQLDRHQNVWMISNGQVHRYEPLKKAYSSYPLPDLEKSGGVTGKLFRDSSGRLYVAGRGYFISFDPDSLKQAKSHPAVHLTDFRIFNKSLSHRLQEPQIRLHHKDNYFAFEFAAPDYAPGGRVHYSYRLAGFDKNWIDAGERNYVNYSNLPGGTYVFQVRATNTPGVWGGKITAVNIRIVPPFWKTAWFYITCALVLSVSIWLLYRYRINELLKRQAIRNKIAQDLHDNVGSTLSSISVYSQVAQIYQQQQKEEELQTTLQKIKAASGEMISELNDTVWAINPRNDGMDVMLQRMESFAKPLLAAQDIRFQMQYDKNLTAVNLDMGKRKSLYAIFKEAVNNAVKYSECKTVLVEIRQQSNNIMMQIQDDGKGFEPASVSEEPGASGRHSGGNGLRNMQGRAKEIHGDLKIYSAPGRGTTIRLVLPIP